MARRKAVGGWGEGGMKGGEENEKKKKKRGIVQEAIARALWGALSRCRVEASERTRRKRARERSARRRGGGVGVGRGDDGRGGGGSKPERSTLAPACEDVRAARSDENSRGARERATRARASASRDVRAARTDEGSAGARESTRRAWAPAGGRGEHGRPRTGGGSGRGLEQQSPGGAQSTFWVCPSRPLPRAGWRPCGRRPRP